jgi:hypothetical protein
MKAIVVHKYGGPEVLKLEEYPDPVPGPGEVLVRVAAATGNGCVECLASPKGWWFHLRRCAECGHIGCCDSSPSQHASKHAAATGHPVIASFEPGEDWFFDYETRSMIKGAELLPPHAHSEDQPAPGPAGKVPANWESLLN